MAAGIGALRNSGTMLAVVYGALLLQGCLIPFGATYRRAPDPEEESLVEVVEVSGTTFRLADGRRFDLAGVSLSGLTKVQQDRFASELRGAVVGKPRMLVLEQDAGRAGLEASYYPQTPDFESLAVPIFPPVVPWPPVRLDMAVRLILLGYAKADRAAHVDEQTRARYVALEARARKKAVGIWARPKE